MQEFQYCCPFFTCTPEQILKVSKIILDGGVAYIMEYYTALKKNEILPFATAWMDLNGIMLSGISQRKANIE